MIRFAHRRFSQVACLAIGVLVLGSCHPLQGQSVPTPPKKSPRVIELEKLIQQRLVAKKQIEDSIANQEHGSQVLQEELAELKKLESTMGVSEESYPEVLKTLHAQRVELLIDLAGIEARFKAIKDAIAVSTEVQSESAHSTLRKLVIIREQDLDRLKQQYQQGVIPSSEVSKAEIALLEAKTRLAQMAANSGGMLDQLNRQLLDTSLEKAEKTARLDKARQLIEEVDAYRVHASKVSGKQRKLNSLAQGMRSLLNDLTVENNAIFRAKQEMEQLLSDPQ